MEFGRIADIGQIDFSLPPDNPLTEELLTSLRGQRERPFHLYTGCTVWGRKEWVGKVYPRGARDKDFLSYYVKQFNCIELNTLFYSLQPKSVIEKWASLADPDFRFCPKFSNTISHQLQLKGAGQETALFIDHMRSFGDRLGTSFLQLSDSFGPDRAGLLQEYVRMLPEDFSTCVELRHADWFRDGVASQPGTGRFAGTSMNVWQVFRERGIGTVITDTAGRRDCLHMILTAPRVLIRFVANNLHPTDLTRIDAWADRIKAWMDKGLKEVYFFVHNKEEINTPELCKYAVERFSKTCGLDLKPPVIQPREPGTLTLFG